MGFTKNWAAVGFAVLFMQLQEPDSLWVCIDHLFGPVKMTIEKGGRLRYALPMSFRENLRTKIQIKQLTRKVLDSMGPVDSGKRTDIDAARELLNLSPYQLRTVRDLDLYVQPADGDVCPIVVLGNDLPLYRSSIADIAMRRSPTLKEMISIRNAIKILNDADVLVTKGPETVAAIQEACLAELDLSFDRDDLAALADDGAAALEHAYQAGVIESLSLFAELLGFEPPPGSLSRDHFYIVGRPQRVAGRLVRFGPVVLYAKIHNRLKLVDASVSLKDPDQIELFQRVADGSEKASVEGGPVFRHLSQSVLDHPEPADR